MLAETADKFREQAELRLQISARHRVARAVAGIQSTGVGKFGGAHLQMQRRTHGQTGFPGQRNHGLGTARLHDLCDDVDAETEFQRQEEENIRQAVLVQA